MNCKNCGKRIELINNEWYHSNRYNRVHCHYNNTGKMDKLIAEPKV